ncbi:hypothetical protein GPA10_22360 [Streptomyces sp. p1417]|uniref:Uncharacterized protein n=1 Tax=Streptomyces typhae TaxID=2681492 RepID=A0A6L6X1A6_9ACTN|nr:hypothetical protein [Streptomyces typhae]MVO87429.1 hypothetical protein [Streptomyces typhae]
MARALFGGSAADVAETVTGARVPGAAGAVWDGPGPDALQVTDLLDPTGIPLQALAANADGMVEAFYGPEGAERLYVDFGAGRVALVPVDIGDRLKAHMADAEAHNVGDRYLDRTTGGEITGPLTVRGMVSADGLSLPGQASRFSRGAVVTSPAGAVTYVICALQKGAQVVGVAAYRSGGSGATINAVRNGMDLLPTDLSLSTEAVWVAAPSVQNGVAVAGDSLAVTVRSVSGAPAYVSFEIFLQGA